MQRRVTVMFHDASDDVSDVSSYFFHEELDDKLRRFNARAESGSATPSGSVDSPTLNLASLNGFVLDCETL